MNIGEQDRVEQTQTWPKELLPEQNFYDQFPFKEVLDALNYDSIPRTAVQHALTRGAISATFGRVEADKTHIKGAGDRLYAQYENPDELRKWFIPPYSERRFTNVTTPILRELLNGLREHELWTEYIVSVFEQSQYNRDGSYVLRSNRHTPTLTYQEWLVQGKIKYQKYQSLSIRSATSEAFPQHYGGSVNAAIRNFGGVPSPMKVRSPGSDEIKDPRSST